MATTIDQKIVEMKFDNRDFEKNTKTTLSTLDKLKLKLNFDGANRGLDEISKSAKKVDMSSLTASLSTVSNKFSAMEIVGITALANITNSAIETGKQLVKSLTVDQVSAGWGKMNQKLGSVQTLVNSTGLSVKEIDEYLSELMWFSDETSYGFTDMTQALAQMTSTGGDIKKLVPMITGIANATAFAGKGAAEFSRVIYNLNQSYGSGALTLMDWKSVQLAGVNSKQLTEELIKAGEELGTIKKGQVTIGNFNDSLKDKWATTKVMEQAFGKFADLSQAAYKAVRDGIVLEDGTIKTFDTASEAIDYLAENYDNLAVKAFRSAQEAKTFKEVIEATADASSSAWMKIFSDIFGNYEEQKIIWTDLVNNLYDWVVEPINRVEEVVRHAFHFDDIQAMWDKLKNNSIVKTMDQVSDKINKASKSLEEYQAIVTKVWRGDFNNVGDNPDRYDLLSNIGWDPRVVQELVNETDRIAGHGKGWTVIDRLTIEDVTKAEKKYGVAISRTNDEQEELNELTKEQTEQLEDLNEEKLKELGLSEEEIRMYQSLQRASKKYGLSIDEIINKMREANGHDLVFGRKNVDTGEYEFNGIAQNLGAALSNIAEAISKAWGEVFKPFGGAELYMILNKMNEFSVTLKKISANEKGLKNLTDTFKGLFSILKLITMIVGGGFRVAFVIFKTVLQTLGVSVLDFTGFMGNLISMIVDFIEKNNFVIEGVAWLTTKIVSLIKTVYQWIQSHVSLNGALETVKDTLEKLKKAFAEWWQGAKDAKDKGKLGEYLIDTFANAFNKLKEYFKSAGNNLINWLGEAFADSKSGLGKWLSKLPMAKEAGELGQYLIDGIVKGLKIGSSKLYKAIKFVADVLLGTFQKIFKIHSPSVVMEEQGGYLMQGLINGIKNFAGYIYDLFSTIGGKIIEIIKNLDLGSVFVMAIGAGGLFAFLKIAKAVNILADGLQCLNGVIFEAKNTLISFQKVLGAIKVKILSSAMKDVAISVAILTASIVVLTQLDVGKVWASIGAIAALIAILAGLTALAGYIGGKGGAIEFGKLALTILAIGIAMGMMAKALAKVASIEKTAWGAVIAFGVMIAAFMGIILLVSHNSENMVKMGGALLAMGVMFLIMARVVKTIGGMDRNELEQGIDALAKFAALIVCLMLATKLLTGSKNVEKIGTTLLSVGAAFYLMARVVKTLGKMDKKELEQGGHALTAFTVLIAGLMWSTKLLTGSKNVDKIGKTLLQIGAAFTLMAISVKILGKMDPGELAKGCIVLTLFGVGIAALMYAMKKIGPKDVANLGRTFMGIAAAMAVMALSVALLSIIKWDGLLRAGIAVGALSYFISGMIKATKDAKELKDTMRGMAIVIGVLAVSLALLSIIKWDRLIPAAASLALVISTLALVFKSLAVLEKVDIKSIAKTLGIMIGLIIIVAAAIGILAAINPDGARDVALGLSAMLIALSGSLFVLSKIGSQIQNIGLGLLGLVGLVGVLALVVGVLALMSGVKNAEKSALILATFMGALTVMLLLTAAVGAIYAATGGIAALGLAGLAALLVILLGVIGVLALMNSVKNVEANMELLMSFMDKMNIMLLKLGIIGPLALTGVTALYGLVALMSAMIVFATAIGALITYLPALQQFAETGLDFMIMIAGKLGEMIGAFVSGALAQISAALPEIGTNLSQFMINAMPFIAGMHLVDGKVLAGVGILSASIILLTAAELINGVGKFLSGGKGFADMGTQLSQFMTNALPFLTIASTLNASMMNGVKSLSSAILALTAADLIQGLTNFITGGSSSLAEFGNQLPALGTNLAEFVSNLGVFSDAQVATTDCAGKAIQALAESAKKLPNEGGWVAKLLGDNSLAKFGEELPDIGTNIAKFVSNLGKFSDPQITTAECACKVITALADAAKKIPNEGGLWAKLFGDNSLAKFAKSMPDVADGVKGFVNKLGNFGDKTDSVNAAADIIKGLADLSKVNLKDAQKDLPEFTKKLSGVGDNIKGFISKIASVSKEDTETASSNLSIIIEAIKTMINTMKSTALDNTKIVEDAFEEIATKAAKALGTDKVMNEIKSQGLNFVNGFANSIKNNSYISENEAKNMAKKALNAVAKAQDSHSPSKETAKLGGYFGQGFVNGIKEYTGKVYSASTSIGEMAKSGLSSAISRISSLIDSDMNTQPTIRPVLDLSEISDGVNSMNSMFNNPSLQLMSNLNSISSGMANRNQNGSNAEVISAIDKLSKNLSNATGDTYNINGITYDDQSSVSDAVQTLIRAVNIERRS